MRGWTTWILASLVALSVACSPKHEKRAVQIEQGNQKLHQAAVLEHELGDKYGIQLDAPASVNWQRLNKADRQVAGEKLAQFISLVAAALEIESQKGIYISNKDRLLNQFDAAVAAQKAMASAR